MTKKTPDPDNPEWTDADLAHARPAADILPAFIGQPATDALIPRAPGRPAKSDRKVRRRA